MKVSISDNGTIEKTKKHLESKKVRVKRALDSIVKWAASAIMTHAKTKRFRSVPGAGSKKGRRKIPAVPGILTRRTGTYIRRIGPPEQIREDHYEVWARVPYARRHDYEGRPVLPQSLKDKHEEIMRKVRRDIKLTMERD